MKAPVNLLHLHEWSTDLGDSIDCGLKFYRYKGWCERALTLKLGNIGSLDELPNLCYSCSVQRTYLAYPILQEISCLCDGMNSYQISQAVVKLSMDKLLTS